MWVLEEMGLSDVWKSLEEAMEVVVMDKKVWYSMKFDRRLLIPSQSDSDVVNITRGNDGHAYLYVGNVKGPCVRPVQVSHKQVHAESEVTCAQGAFNGRLEEWITGVGVEW